jgi:hypothetical protein
MDIIIILIFLNLGLLYIHGSAMNLKRKPKIINSLKVEDFEVVLNLLADEMNNQSVLVCDQVQNQIMVLEKYQVAQNWRIKVSLNMNLLNLDDDFSGLRNDYITIQNDKIIFNFKSDLDLDNQLVKLIKNILISSNVSKINYYFEKKSLWYIKNV